MPLPSPSADSTALVTGASSGIGREFARGLAKRGHGVTLVARRADRLEELAEDLRRGHGVRAEVIPADLARREERDRIAQEVAARDLAVEILVNNAGFGVYAAFGSAPLEREREQVDVLVAAVVDLTALFLPAMLERGRGAIINLSSTSGFQPLPGNIGYAAAKAFVLLHSEGLHEEVRDQGVTVTAVCPGPVRTEFQDTSSPQFQDRLPKAVWCDPDRVAEDALRAAERGKRTIIPGGLRVRLAFGLNRRTPNAITLPVSKRLMSKELSG
jgi:uncharacterized protein